MRESSTFTKAWVHLPAACRGGATVGSTDLHYELPMARVDSRRLFKRSLPLRAGLDPWTAGAPAGPPHLSSDGTGSGAAGVTPSAGGRVTSSESLLARIAADRPPQPQTGKLRKSEGLERLRRRSTAEKQAPDLPRRERARTRGRGSSRTAGRDRAWRYLT